jgi:hypothetical protein
MSRWILCCWACWGTINYWGDNAAAVDFCVRSFLVEAWAARELAVAARGPATVLELEVDQGSEHVPGHGRVRVPAPIGSVGSAAGAVLGAGERICAECHSRRQPDDMMRCQACLRWFHRSCGGAVYAVGSQSVGDWVCGSACLCQWLSWWFPFVHSPPATARGPMALALRPVHNIFLSFFQQCSGGGQPMPIDQGQLSIAGSSYAIKSRTCHHARALSRYSHALLMEHRT